MTKAKPNIDANKAVKENEEAEKKTVGKSTGEMRKNQEIISQVIDTK